MAGELRSHQQAGHMTAIAKEPSHPRRIKEHLPRGRPHISGVSASVVVNEEHGRQPHSFGTRAKGTAGFGRTPAALWLHKKGRDPLICDV